jgi:hypothetical protein
MFPQFVLVMSVSPFNGGNFGRAGLRFSREWRPLEVAEVADLEKNVIDPEILERLKRESFLAVKPATAEEVARLAEDRASASKDKDTELAELKSKNADLESRLMRLEVGTAPAAGERELAELRSKNAELESRLAGLAAIEARLMKLELRPAERAAETSPMSAPPATDKPGKSTPASGK